MRKTALTLLACLITTPAMAEGWFTVQHGTTKEGPAFYKPTEDAEALKVGDAKVMFVCEQGVAATYFELPEPMAQWEGDKVMVLVGFNFDSSTSVIYDMIAVEAGAMSIERDLIVQMQASNSLQFFGSTITGRRLLGVIDLKGSSSAIRGVMRRC